MNFRERRGREGQGMSAYQTQATTSAYGVPVTEIATPDGAELTSAWVAGGWVCWDDPGAGTVHLGTPLEFHEWMVLHTS